MPAVPEVFDLVKTMTKSEKRYFRLQSGLQKTGSKYTKLFDALDSMKEYDEATLKAKLAKVGITSGIPSIRTNLFNQLTKVLLMYGGGNDQRVEEVEELIRKSRLLAERNMQRPCERMLDKALGICERNGFFHLWSIVLTLKERFVYRVLPVEERHELYMESYALKKQINEWEVSWLGLREMWSEFSVVQTNHRHYRTPEAREKIDDIYRRFEQLEGMEQMHSRVYNYYLSLQADLLNYQGRTKEAYETTKRKFEYYEENDHRHGDLGYLYHMNNLMHMLLTAQAFDDYPKFRQKFLDIELKGELQKRAFHERFHAFEITYLMTVGKLDEAQSYIMQNRELFFSMEESHTTSYVIQLYYISSLILFYQQDWEELQIWLTKIDAYSGQNLREDLIPFAKIMLIVTYYELGLDSLLASQMRATFRYLKQKKRLLKFEKITLKYMRKMTGLGDEQAIKKAMKKMDAELAAIEDDPIDNQYLNYLKLRRWLHSQLQQSA